MLKWLMWRLTTNSEVATGTHHAGLLDQIAVLAGVDHGLEHQTDFFFEGHLAEQVFDARFDGLAMGLRKCRACRFC